jgi:hypothetical protein
MVNRASAPGRIHSVRPPNWNSFLVGSTSLAMRRKFWLNCQKSARSLNVTGRLLRFAVLAV